MATFKTPGVYVQEIPTLPASIAPVATAIAGFVGYTEKAIINGSQWTYPTGKPAPAVRITSLLQYEQLFGFPFHEQFEVTLQNPPNAEITISRNTPAVAQNFILYYQVQMFFANGGSVCWIVSVGDYSVATIDDDDFVDGLVNLESIDEVTLLLVPEAIKLTGTGERKKVNDAMLAQCAKLGDRFSVFDVFSTGDVNTDMGNFRDDDVGPDNLKYGAAYYPPLDTPLLSYYFDDEVLITDDRPPGAGPFNDFPNNTLFTILNGISDNLIIEFTGNPANNDDLDLDGNIFTAKTTPVGPNDFKIETLAVDTAANLEKVLKKANLSKFLISRDGAFVGIRSATSGPITPPIPFDNQLSNTASTPSSPGDLDGGIVSSSDKALYNRIKAELNSTYTLNLYPAPSMAGVYTRVDNERGVWQSPANVGLRSVITPSVLITNFEQEDMNINSSTGKSVNAIRKFVGRGNVVWGARTLAGNDNEWRYVNVRRLFLMIEESCQEATEFVVFEPNTANTWEKVKGMITAFLTNLWRDGALAGAVPADAFFVEVGLGTTMTQDDILSGIMNVRIGIAAVRPAEFIILKFSHKLQES